jgi:hypothetical protein
LILFVLICATSLNLQSSISLNIYNWCQDINLTSLIYFLHGGKWHVVPDQEIDVNTVMRNCLESDSGQDILEGALVYEIQRKLYNESDGFIQDDSKGTQLLVVWHGEYTKGLYVRAVLIEHDKGFDWNEDKLRRLYQKYWYPLDVWVDFIGSNWLLDDTTVLTTAIKVINGGYRWDIFISEERTSNYVVKPFWINSER